MDDYISRQAAKELLKKELLETAFNNTGIPVDAGYAYEDAAKRLEISWMDLIPAADVRSIPEGGIGEMSDGYHTFNGLYYQRMMLFAALVKAHKGKAWKSRKHEDGKLCFGGGWFIVGINTPDGDYTYHYEDKYFAMFDCKELPVAPHWDGHTEEDITRLLSLPDVRPVRRGRWEIVGRLGNEDIECSICGEPPYWHATEYGIRPNFCPNCGADMRPKNNKEDNKS